MLALLANDIGCTRNMNGPTTLTVLQPHTSATSTKEPATVTCTAVLLQYAQAHTMAWRGHAMMVVAVCQAHVALSWLGIRYARAG